MSPSIRSKSFWKHKKLCEKVEELKNNNFTVSFLAIAETWLKSYISDAQLFMQDYNIFRCDRNDSEHGGVLLYIHNSIHIDTFSCFDDDICNAVICVSTSSKCIISCIYRPPTASVDSFSNLLNFIDNFINLHNKLDKFKSFLFGDFNFPQLNWKDCELQNYSSPATTKLKNFTDDHLLLQYIKSNTRKNNILDLFFTNNSDFVQFVKIHDALISDHYLIEIFTSFFNNNSSTGKDTHLTNNLDHDFSKLNLSTANFEQINLEFAKINWNSLFTGVIEDIPKKFNKKVFAVLQKYSKPFKYNTKFKNSFAKNRKIISRKITKLNKRLKFSNYNLNKNQTQIKINKLRELTKRSYFEERIFYENKAIDQIKTDSKYFFNYAKKFKTVISSPSMLQNSKGDIITDKVEISNLLQDQFKSVFSEPISEIKHPSFPKPNITQPLPKFELTNLDIENAIDEIKSTSSCPKDEIPALVFKRCKQTLSTPLRVNPSKQDAFPCSTKDKSSLLFLKRVPVQKQKITAP